MSRSVTQLLNQWREGNATVRDELWPLMYQELRRLAMHHMQDQREGHTLQATALVNEAFLKLEGVEYRAENRREFFALAARAMRSILVDHARARGRDKRGGNASRVDLTEAFLTRSDAIEDVIYVDQSLNRLAEKDARMATIAELRIFGGLSFDEIAEALGISNSTARTDMRFAKAWLSSDIEQQRD